MYCMWNPASSGSLGSWQWCTVGAEWHVAVMKSRIATHLWNEL